MTPEVCPNCGAEVPRSAKACPECGADEETGWSEAAAAANLGLPDEEFNYEDFVRKEFGARSPVPRGMHWGWWIVALFVITALLWLWMR